MRNILAPVVICERRTFLRGTQGCPHSFLRKRGRLYALWGCATLTPCFSCGFSSRLWLTGVARFSSTCWAEGLRNSWANSSDENSGASENRSAVGPFGSTKVHDDRGAGLASEEVTHTSSIAHQEDFRSIRPILPSWPVGVCITSARKCLLTCAPRKSVWLAPNPRPGNFEERSNEDTLFHK